MRVDSSRAGDRKARTHGGHFRLDLNQVDGRLDSTRRSLLAFSPLAPSLAITHLLAPMAPPRSQRKRSSKAKRKKNDAAAAASSSSSSRLEFANLPHELRSYIVELACILPPSISKSAATTRHIKAKLPLDLSATLSLLTVSRTFYDLVIPVLYGSVTLPRPSTLESFLRAVSDRPQLGKLVKLLRVGDVDPLPDRWFPMEQAKAPLTRIGGWALVTSLRSIEEAKLLPRGFTSEQQWPVQAVTMRNKRSKAAHNALIAIQRCLDVDLTRQNSAYREQAHIESAEGMIQCYEVQAAFDLYLMAMRRWEVAGRSNYPPLYITGYPCNARTGPPPQLDAGFYILDRADILRHLARPRAITDRFEHYLVSARSGISIVRRSMGEPEDEDKASRAARLRTSLPRTASIELITALLVDLLSRTPHLRALSVSVYLEQVIYDARFTAVSSLRYLSIGHRGYVWSKPLDVKRLAALEHLRIRRMILKPREIEAMIAGLPLLKTLTIDWRLPIGPVSKVELLR